jgi:hypothetical protein
MFKQDILIWDEDSSELLVIKCDLVDKIEPLKAFRYWLLDQSCFVTGDEYIEGGFDDYLAKYISTIRDYSETDSEGDVKVFHLTEGVLSALNTRLEEKYSYNWDGPLDEEDDEEDA